MRSLIKRSLPYIILKPTMLGPLLLPRAFQSGVSLERLSAYHLKSHTFTQFYLKNVPGADFELFDLGPVMAARQIHY